MEDTSQRPKETKTADELAAMIIADLRQVEGCPKEGVTVYVYGIPWNALLMFGAAAGPVPNRAELNSFSILSSNGCSDCTTRSCRGSAPPRGRLPPRGGRACALSELPGQETCHRRDTHDRGHRDGSEGAQRQNDDLVFNIFVHFELQSAGSTTHVELQSCARARHWPQPLAAFLRARPGGIMG